MTTLEQLNLSQPLTDIYTAMETDLMMAIARQLTRDGEISATSEWRIKKLAEAGALSKETVKIIASYTGIQSDLLTETIEASAYGIIDRLEPALQQVARDGLIGSVEHKAISDSTAKVVANFRAQAKTDLNLVNTVMQYKSKATYTKLVNKIYDEANRQELLSTLGKHSLATAAGAVSRQEAVRNCIKEFSQKGIPAFVDKAGREWSPEAYINMDIRTTVNNTAHAAQDACCDKYDIDLFQISSHNGARPKCARDQGKLVSRSNRSGIAHDGNGNPIPFIPLSQTSYGQPDGIFGINCHHKKYPFIDGVNFQRYFPYDEEENAERYKELQKQRYLERRIRETSRQVDMLKETGDIEGAKEARRKLTAQRKAYREYSDSHGLAQHNDRLTVTRVRKGDNVFADIHAKPLDNGGGSGIIKNIEVPSSVHGIKGMSDELFNEIQNSLNIVEKEYRIRINNIPVKPLGKGFEKVPFQFQANPIGASVQMDIVVNSDYDFNGSLEAFNNRIMRNHNSGALAAKNVQDLIWHESIHVLTFQDCTTYTEALNRADNLRNQYVKGISRYADESYDGAECMAEAFIKKKYGKSIPKEINILLEKYIERWKK